MSMKIMGLRARVCARTHGDDLGWVEAGLLRLGVGGRGALGEWEAPCLLAGSIEQSG